MPLTKPKGVGEITSVTTPLVHTRSRCSVLTTLLEPDQRCPPSPTAATADAMRTPLWQKAILASARSLLSPCTDCVHPGTGFNRSALSHHLRISANALKPRSPSRRSTISNDDQLSLAHGSYCKLRDWDRDREVDRIPLCVNDWGLPQDCAI